MRKLIFGLFTFAAVGIGALAAPPAEAQPYYPGYGRHHGPVVVQYGRPAYREYHRPNRGYRPYRTYRPAPYYRPVFAGPRCVVRPQRVWTAYGWARRPVRVCRY